MARRQEGLLLPDRPTRLPTGSPSGTSGDNDIIELAHRKSGITAPLPFKMKIPASSVEDWSIEQNHHESLAFLQCQTIGVTVKLEAHFKQAGGTSLVPALPAPAAAAEVSGRVD